MNGPRVKEILSLTPEQQTLSVTGWIRTVRDSKEFAFAELNDGSCLSNLQLFLDKKKPELAAAIPGLST
ncbi:MAG TPA: asparagine--tRNA ligase, partial [Spirochaetia bacterium]|nr:asparagine--tRNA ligase [Spirochaetia bacterium]